MPPICCYGEPMKECGDGIWQCVACRYWRFVALPPTDDPYLTGTQTAAFLGVSRKTLYRYVDDGLVPGPEGWRASILAKLTVERPKMSYPRNPRAVRYTTGRHRIDEVRPSKAKS